MVGSWLSESLNGTDGFNAPAIRLQAPAHRVHPNSVKELWLIMQYALIRLSSVKPISELVRERLGHEAFIMRSLAAV